MVSKRTVAAVAFWIGALTITGAVLQGALLAYPATVIFAALLMVPYVYMNIRQGMREGTAQADAS